MKNKSWLVLFPAIFVLLLVSCGSRAEEAAAMEEELPDISASDLLVDSLEYLLDEEEGSAQNEGGNLIEVEELPQEEEKPQVEVMIYYGNGASEELNAEVSTMEQVSAENLVDALIHHNIVSVGTKVLSFEEKEADGEKTLYLDLSKTFREYLMTMTQKGENIILSSVTATFLEAYDADKIMITINGEVLETEHATYEEPFRCEPGELLAE